MEVLTRTQVALCQVCDFSTKVRSSLKSHKNKHIGKQFSCNICTDKFTLKASVKIHIRGVHQGITRSCKEEGCDYKTAISGYQKRHICLRYECEFENCSYKSSMKEIYYNHVKSAHSGQILKKFTCDYENCDYRAISTSKVKQHIRSRHK